MNQLLQILQGKKIALVGNETPQGNYSDEIDTADIVIRFNHFYNYDSGKVGKRVDIILQTVTTAWYNAIKDNKAHIDVVKEQCPEVFLVKRPDHYNTDVHAMYGKDVKINTTANWFSPWWKYTTGTAALCYLAQNLTNAEVKCYGFSNEGSDEHWNEYINGPAAHYKGVSEEERKTQLNAIKTLESLTITELKKGIEIPRAIVVPVKQNSEGCPGKNKILLRTCLEKLQSLNIPIYVVGDDIELMHSVKDLCKAVPLETIGAYDDVTKTLRKWQVETGFCGDIAVVQCTSPYLKAEWVIKCFEELKYAAITATAVELEYKPTAIFYEVSGVYTPLAKQLPSASVARQMLPKAMRITGAVECFHTDNLVKESLWQTGCVRPVFVSEEESLDIDTKEDLEKYTSNNK